jgi:hypothetical protein
LLRQQEKEFDKWLVANFFFTSSAARRVPQWRWLQFVWSP